MIPESVKALLENVGTRMLPDISDERKALARELLRGEG